MNPAYDCALVRYGELSLKGPGVRRKFELRLIQNISACLDDAGLSHEISRIRGRLIVKSSNPEFVCRTLSKVFGIVSCSPAVCVGLDAEAMAQAAVDLSRATMKEGGTFAIETNRGNKAFPLTSQEVNHFVGERVRIATKGRVDLRSPETTIGIDIRDSAYVFQATIKGPGGLPMGTGGRTISLFSGGIDSPVATYLVMKRGCEMILLYCDNTPFCAEDSMDRMMGVAKVLSSYASGFPLRVIVSPMGECLSTLVKVCPRNLTCTMCKRMMTRIAAALAEINRCSAIVTGSSLAQVCSQTLANLALTLTVSKIPVLTPLVGFDKEEIVVLARRIGTYERSIASVAPCRAAPTHPLTHPSLEEVEEAESRVDVQGLVDQAVKGSWELDLG